jgi:hypothetical protein
LNKSKDRPLSHVPSQKPGKLLPVVPSRTVYCAGDLDRVLRYDLNNDRWSFFNQNKSSNYKGDLKYTGLSRISNSALIMTGGVSSRDLKPSTMVYYISIDELSNKCEFTLMKSLIEPRYGHSQCFNDGAIFVIGGFDHEDIIGLPPSTLSACELYIPPEDKNRSAHCEPIGHLNLPRAYAGCCQIGSFIYVFGGLNGYDTLSSIE